MKLPGSVWRMTRLWWSGHSECEHKTHDECGWLHRLKLLKRRVQNTIKLM